jgi:hypothetical protein
MRGEPPPAIRARGCCRSARLESDGYPARRANLCIPADSNQSSLSQLVTRYSQHWRFIRRHLFGLGPITQCQRCWATRWRGESGGRTPVPPASQAHTRPNRSDSDEGRSRRPPPKPSARHVTPSAGGDAADPPGPARAAQAWSRDSAVRAQTGPGCRLVERPRSGSSPAELPTVGRDPGPARARAARSGAGREPGARLPAAAPSAGGATRIRAGPRGRPEKARP